MTREDGFACRQCGVEGCQSRGEVVEERRELRWWVAEVGIGTHARQRKQRVLELVPGVLVLPLLVMPSSPVGRGRDYAPSHTRVVGYDGYEGLTVWEGVLHGADEFGVVHPGGVVV